MERSRFKSRYRKPRSIPQDKWDRLSESQKSLLLFMLQWPVHGLPQSEVR